MRVHARARVNVRSEAWRHSLQGQVCGVLERRPAWVALYCELNAPLMSRRPMAGLHVAGCIAGPVAEMELLSEQRAPHTCAYQPRLRRRGVALELRTPHMHHPPPTTPTDHRPQVAPKCNKKCNGALISSRRRRPVDSLSWRPLVPQRRVAAVAAGKWQRRVRPCCSVPRVKPAPGRRPARRLGQT